MSVPTGLPSPRTKASSRKATKRGVPEQQPTSKAERGLGGVPRNREALGPRLRSPVPSQSITAASQEQRQMGQEPTNENRALSQVTQEIVLGPLTPSSPGLRVPKPSGHH